VLNATFNNISVISCFLLEIHEKQGMHEINTTFTKGGFVSIKLVQPRHVLLKCLYQYPEK